MRTILIGGKEFELCKNTCGVDYFTALDKCSTKTVYDCYSKPSVYKIGIWASWCKWFNEHDFATYGVSSYNCNFFTIQGIADVDGQPYLLTITRSHWKAMPLEV